jgi:hypothetical protein
MTGKVTANAVALTLPGPRPNRMLKQSAISLTARRARLARKAQRASLNSEFLSLSPVSPVPLLSPFPRLLS